MSERKPLEWSLRFNADFPLQARCRAKPRVADLLETTYGVGEAAGDSWEASISGRTLHTGDLASCLAACERHEEAEYGTFGRLSGLVIEVREAEPGDEAITIERRPFPPEG